MKILLITPYYFPYENPRAFRWTCIVNELTALGHEVMILTSKDLIQDDGNDLTTIHRFGYSTPDKKVTKDTSPARSFPFRGLAKKIFEFFMWPDESVVWGYGLILDGMKTVLAYQPDVMISVSWPFSSHLAARSFHSKLNVPWLVDVGDPFHLGCWPPRNNPWFFKGRNKKIEGEVFSKSSAVCVTTNELADIYLEVIPREKCHVIGPMHSPFEARAEVARSGSIKLGYFGSLYDKVRDPQVLLDFIVELGRQTDREIDIHFYGHYKAEHSKVIKNLVTPSNIRVILNSAVPRENVIGKMKTMDVLINLGNWSTTQLPSKVVDYGVSGRPVLHLAQIDNDPTISFFEDHDAFISWEEGGSSWEELLRFLSNARDCEVDSTWKNKIQVRSSPEGVARRYLEVLEKIIGD